MGGYTRLKIAFVMHTLYHPAAEPLVSAVHMFYCSPETGSIMVVCYPMRAGFSKVLKILLIILLATRSEATENPANDLIGYKICTSQGEYMIKSRPVTLNCRKRKLQLLPQKQKEFCYQLNSGLAWRYFPSMTPVSEE